MRASIAIACISSWCLSCPGTILRPGEIETEFTPYDVS